MPQRTSVTEKAKAAQRAAFCYFGGVSANMAIHKLFPAALEFLSNLFAMLPERRRRRIDARPAMGNITVQYHAHREEALPEYGTAFSMGGAASS